MISMILEDLIVKAQYLQQVAPRYGFKLNMGEMRTVGLVALIVISIIVILDLHKKFRRPKKKRDNLED